MHPTTSDSSLSSRDESSAAEFDPLNNDNSESEQTETRNFIVMVAYQVIMRVGWIFKTESVIMPAVLDSIGGAGWLRGCLPMFNRFGQSVPPLLMARRIKVLPCKKWALTICTSLMAFSFLALSAIWLVLGAKPGSWQPIVFIFFYAMFFISTGVNQIALGTLQGKLVRVNRRGRLLLIASILGAVFAIGAAVSLLPFWLRADGGDFGLIFGFAGLCFALSAASALCLRERPDNHEQPPHPFIEHFTNAIHILRSDSNFRRLAFVGALFGTSIMLFPHYQALGREKLSLQFDSLIWYVVIQNVGVALFSYPVGSLADRFGNRMALRLTMLAMCAAPIAALILAYLGPVGRSVYYLVFLLVGLTPVTIKTFNNYTLEICTSSEHPRYLSTLGICVSAPVFLSPLVGLLVDALNFESVFIGITVLVFIGWLLTFGLQEPRHHVSTSAVPAPVTGE